ncbi:MAG: ADP-ribosylation factor-like protein [Promethearchaeota archaeon]
MLYNIFLFKGKEFQDLKDLNIYCYPKEIININNRLLVNNIIKGHNQEKSIKETKKASNGKRSFCNTSNHYKIDKPVAQYVDDLNIYTTCIDETIIIGLIFENDDNPYDYKEIFEELLCELLNNGNGYSFDEEIEIDSLLISMFIDIRRYGDEVVEKTPEFEYYYQRESFFKVFLFGIDEVGKTSFIRRLKTGEFNDNYFTPTRKFSIEYIQAGKKGLLAFWDMPGQQLFRSKWLIGLQDSNIIVYMIDIANQRRFEESKRELWKILNNDDLNGIPLLVLGNKVDLIKYSNENQIQNLKNEILDYFSLDQITNRNWEFIFTSVKTNYNIDITIESIFDLIQCY